MSRLTATLLALSLVLTGCGSADEGRISSGSSSADTTTDPNPTADPTDSATVGLPEAADGTDVSACFDGNCEILATSALEVPVDPDFGVDTFTIVELDAETVTVEATGAGTYLKVTISPEGAGSLNGILVSVVALDEEQAVLSFSTS